MKMDIFDLLKQLKNEIKPDKDYMMFSRKKIIAEFNQEFFDINNKKVKITIWQTIRSFVFTAFILVIIFGLFSLFKNITPKLSVLNPEAIKAEADAIDFQIKVSKLIYDTPEKSNMILSSVLNKNNKDLNLQSSTPSSTLEIENILKNDEIQSSTQTSKIDIDEVLNYLAK